MPNVSSPAALPQYLEQLLNQRKHHVNAIASIDSTLERVTAALGGATAKPVVVASMKKRGRPFKIAPAVIKAPVPPKAAAKSAKAGMTANEFVLAFVASKKNPTTQEINKHWKVSGRKGMADNNLSLLTKAKKLKRMPLGGGLRGSRYAVA